MHEQIPPVALSWARWTLASLIIVPLAYNNLKHDWPVIRTNLPILCFLGAIGVGFFNLLHYVALNYTTALNVVVLQSSTPFVITIVSFLIFRETITARQGVGIVISMIGVLYILTRGDLSALASLSFGTGDLIFMTAVILWAVYTTLLRKKPQMSALSFAAVTFVIGAISNIPLVLVEHIYDRQLTADLPTALSIAYVAIFPSVISYVFYNKGVEYIGSARAGAFIYLVPFMGAILALIFLSEHPKIYHAVGFTLILLGIWLTVRTKK